MGYLDAVVNGMFKTAKDGRKIFFPWWPFGRGYAIPSEEYYQRLRKQCKNSFVYLFIYVVLISLLGAPNIAILLAAVPYSIWGYLVCRHLERSDEILTVNEKIANQARESSVFALWLLLILSLALVGAGIFLIAVNWRSWQSLLAAMLAIVIFGFCVIIGVKALKIKKRQGI